MNLGYVGIGLGAVGIVIGGAMYASDYHRTIGLGGVVLGIILILGGIWLWRSKPAAKMATPAQSGPTA